MKSIKMKGKNVEEATKAALAVLGLTEEKVNINIINEGKPAVMGIIGGEEAEIEAVMKEEATEEAKDILQNILDKMGLLAIADVEFKDETINLTVRGEDMGRIIGKEGAMLRSLEIIIGSIISKKRGERIRVSVDAGDYKKKRVSALERLAAEVVAEVEETGQEKVMPQMTPADRRSIHMYLKDNQKVTSFSKGEGKERRLVIAPKS